MSKMTKAVAVAVLAMGATAAQAGITIPAGDWTIDIGGNVNAYYTHTTYDGVLDTASGNPGGDSSNTIGTGLLPAAIGFGGKTRQNDLDIAFQFTFFTGTDSATGAGSANVYGANGAGGNSLNIRQAFMTFGDKSWGTIKMGRDLGLFGSDAILSDMTLLGVGTGGGGTGNSTLGRIGSGYLYADWVGQIQYMSPNWNGFSFGAAARQSWGNTDNSDLGFDAKASYEWGGDVSGKAWVGYINQSGIDATTALGAPLTGAAHKDSRSDAWEIGAKISVAGFGLVGYYYDGQGMGGSAVLSGNLPVSGLGVAFGERDVDGGYVQATWTAPFGTKFGVSWGESNIDKKTSLGDTGDYTNESWIVGVYHPLTKSLNLVAEYTDTEYDNIGNVKGGSNVSDGGAKTLALGAILFF